MSQAEIRHIPPDPERAKGFLSQARRLAQDGAVLDVSDTGRQFLMFQACVAACDAALIADGRIVEGSDGGHVLRLREVSALLDLDGELVEALADAREIRGASAYRAGIVMGHQLEETGDATDRLIEAVADFISQ